MIRFIFRFVLIGIVAVILGFCAIHYKADIPADEIIKKYALPDSKFIEIEGQRIHYRRKGTGETLVLVHGFSANLRNWSAWYDMLSNAYDVICMDLPGYGLTGPVSKSDYSDSSQAAFLDRFMTAMHVDSFYLAGNSMGGSIAWHYALSYPDKVKKLILINSAGYADQEKKENVLGFALLRMPVIKDLITAITPRFIVERSVRKIYGDPAYFTQEEADIYYDMMLREGNRSILLERMKLGFTDESSKISQISQPTLILWGDKDLLIDVRNAYKFDGDIKNSKLTIYENIGHVPMIEHAEQSAKDLVNFLRQI